MSIQEEYDNKRRERLNGTISHHIFFLWVCDKIGLNSARYIPCSLDRVRHSRDPHLNDIPLSLWDSQHSAVRSMALNAGLRSWSLSDTVCSLKTLARHLSIA